MVRNGISRVCFYLCSAEWNFGLCSLPGNGYFHCKKRESLVSGIPAGDGKTANLFPSVAIGTIAAVESPFHSLTLTLWSLLSGGRTSLSLMTAVGAEGEAWASLEVGIDTCKYVECSTAIEYPTWDQKEWKIVLFWKTEGKDHALYRDRCRSLLKDGLLHFQCKKHRSFYPHLPKGLR